MPLKVHFLNVGRGDCTIIQFPTGRVGMVDIDNLKVLDSDTRAEILAEYRNTLEYQFASKTILGGMILEGQFLKKEEEGLTDPLAYYDAHIGKSTDIFRMIITHPDMDHMTGLYRLHKQDPNKSIINFWHTGKHDFNLANTTNKEWEDSPYDRRDWETYKELRDGDNPKSLQKYQGNTGQFWTDDGMELWAPTPALEDMAVEKEDANILSLVLKITYKGRSIILGGDATADDSWSAIYPKLKMTGIAVLKASHHGRKSGYYGPAVKEMSPWLTITSVGEAEHDATDNYRRYSEYTVSLRKAGDICIEIADDGVLYYPPHLEDHWKPRKAD